MRKGFAWLATHHAIVLGWLGVLFGLIGMLTGIRGCQTSENSVSISREIEFRQYIYEAADLIGMEPGGAKALSLTIELSAKPKKVDRRKFEQARRLLEKAEILKPRDSNLHALWAFYFMGLRDVEHAIESASQVETAGTDSDLLVLTAVILALDPRRTSTAHDFFVRATENSPDDVAIMLLHATFLHQLARNAEARKVLQRATSVEPSNPAVVNALVHVLYESNQRDSALSLSLSSIDRGLESANLYNTLGVIYDSVPDLASAEAQFRRAIELEGGNPLFHHNLAVVLNRQKRREDAKASAAKAKELGWVDMGNGTISAM
jgi:Flp pilus assembly protein TadD